MPNVIIRVTGIAVVCLLLAYTSMALDMREVAKTLDAQNEAINSLVSILAEKEKQ